MSKITSEAHKEASNHFLETDITRSALAGDGPGYAGDALTSSFPNNSAKSLQRAVNSISQAAYPASRLGIFQKAVRNSQNSNQTATRLARSYKATTATLARTQTKSNASASKGESGNSSSNKGSLQRSTLVASAAVAPGLHLSGLDALPAAVRAHATQILSAIEEGLAELGPALSQLATRAVNAVGGAIRVVATMAEASEVGEVLGTLSLAIEGLGAVELVISTGGLVLVVAAIGAVALSDSQGAQSGYSYEAPATPPPSSSSYDPYATTPSNDVRLPDPAEYNAPITIPDQPLPEFHPRPAPKPYTNPALATRAWAKYKQGWDYYDQVLQNSQSDPALSQVFLDSQSIPSRTLAMVSQKLNDLENDLRIFDPYHDGKGGFGAEVQQAAQRIQATRIGAVDKAMQDMNTVIQQVRHHAQQDAQRDQQIATGQIPLPAATTVNQGGVRVTTYSQATVAAADRVYHIYDQGDQLVRHIQGSLSQLTGGNQSQIGLLQQHLPSLAQLDTLVGQLNDFAKQNRGMGWADTMGNPNLSKMIPLANQIEQLIPQVQSEKQAFDQQVSTAGLQSLLTIPATRPNPLPPTMPPQHIPQTEPQTDSTVGGGQGGNTGGRIGGGSATPPTPPQRDPQPNRPEPPRIGAPILPNWDPSPHPAQPGLIQDSQLSGPPEFGPAHTLAEYIALVRQAESRLQLSPYDMLAMLRQAYYGRPWSRKTKDFWDPVIPGSPEIGDPRSKVGQQLYEALQASQVSDNNRIDIGHMIATLEAMFHPASQVFEGKGPVGYTIEMPNEEMAGYGGDIGAYAGHKAFIEVESHHLFDWQTYFNLKAMDESNEPISAQLIGDIDAYIISKGIANGGQGAPAAGRPLPQASDLSRPISEIMTDYYLRPQSHLGQTQGDRFTIFAQSIGGVISNGKITNKDELVAKITPRIRSFAGLYYFLYVKKYNTPSERKPADAELVQKLQFHGGIPPINVDMIGRLDTNSREVTEWFINWVESRMSQAH